MAEKYFRLYFFSSLNISDFNLFLCENYNPHWKLFENLVGGSPPHPPPLPRCRQGGDAHYGPMMEEVSLKIVFLIKHN